MADSPLYLTKIVFWSLPVPEMFENDTLKNKLDICGKKRVVKQLHTTSTSRLMAKTMICPELLHPIFYEGHVMIIP